MRHIHRRNFLHTAGAAAIAGAASGALGANDRPQIAVIGVGGRGTDHVREYLGQPNCRIAAVCDIDSGRLERAETLVYSKTGVKPKTYVDMRQVFDDKNVDAVSIAAPNHWHALATIWACQAGKDVYIEKPASHNLWEGRKMVEAARKYNRIVQVGMQSRNIAHKREIIELLRQGVIGKIYMAKALCFKRRKSIGRTPDGPVPPGVDWDRFLGPAPVRAFNQNRFHYNWHWFWDTGNGDIGNQGVHEMDIARWGLGKQELPKSVFSSGGKFLYDDDQETPNTQLATFDYGDCQLIFEVRGLLTGAEGAMPQGGHVIGNLFYGSDGWVMVDVNEYKIFKGEKSELASEVKYKEKRAWDTTPHIANFLSAVRSRKTADLNAGIEEGHLSAALCHLANTSYRLGRKLTFDPARERFVNDEQANRMLTRDYRRPYVVPEKV
jgi:predicted dehydrogenase